MRNTVGKKHFPEACKNLERIAGADKRLQDSSVAFPDLQGVRTCSKKAPKHREHSRRYTNTLNEQWDCQPPHRDPGLPAQKRVVLTAFRKATQTWLVSDNEPPACLTPHSTGLLQGASIHLGSADQATSSPFLSATVVLPQHSAPGTARHTQPGSRFRFKPFRQRSELNLCFQSPV